MCRAFFQKVMDLSHFFIQNVALCHCQSQVVEVSLSEHSALFRLGWQTLPPEILNHAVHAYVHIACCRKHATSKENEVLIFIAGSSQLQLDCPYFSHKPKDAYIITDIWLDLNTWHGLICV